jgi:uncharacterized membrane protein YsdA (DUF1294 family)
VAGAGSASGRSGLCFLGGVGGAWLVFFEMRHKTQRRSFWIVQSVATVLWVGLLLWPLVS